MLAYLGPIVNESLSLPTLLFQVNGYLRVSEGVPEAESVLLGEGAKQSLPLGALVEGLVLGEGRTRPVVVQLHRMQASD